MLSKLRRGLILRHTEKSKKGVVIDWGSSKLKFLRYVPAEDETADSVRVWTASAIEVWPLNAVAFEED